MDWTNGLTHLWLLPLVLLIGSPWGLATEVYKDPFSSSSFARSSPQDLEKTKNAIFEETWFFVETGQGEAGWVAQSDIISIWDFVKEATTLNETALLREPNLLLKPLREIKADEEVKTYEMKFGFLRVQTKKGSSGWVLAKDLKPSLNVYSFIVKKDYKEHKIWRKAGQKISPSKANIQKMEDLLTPFDLDVVIKFENKTFIISPQRQGRWIADRNQKFWSLDQTQIIDNKNEILYTSPQKKKVCLREEPTTENHDCQFIFATSTRLKVLSQTQVRWVRSVTQELGVVFWNPSSQAVEEMTENKNNIKQAINSRHIIFQGDLKSVDGGKSFHPYLRWDKIIALYMRQTREEPQSLEIKKIEITKNDHLLLHLRSQAGNQVRFLSKDDGNNWKALDSQK